LPFWPGEYVAEFEDIRPTDTQARLDEIRATYPVLSINEIRQRYYHLPSVAWGEMPVGMQPASANAQPVLPAPAAGNHSAADDAGDSVKALLDELGRWERFALKRW